MEVTKPSLVLIWITLGIVLFFAHYTEPRTVATESHQKANTGEATSWCIVKPSTENEKLRQNIDYSCGQSRVDCRSIQPGGSCFEPDNPVSHASVAMNLFYKAAGKRSWNCHFDGTGLIVYQNPSFGNCDYPA